MRVVLRDLKSGWYYAGQKMWIDGLEGAVSFATVEEASAAAWDSGGQDVAVVLRYENPARELALNPAYCGRPPRRNSRLPV